MNNLLDAKNVIFDLYGTLVDIHTDEEQPGLWRQMAALYTARGAAYTPEALRAAYEAQIGAKEAGLIAIRKDAHEAHPEIRIEDVFLALYTERGVQATAEQAVETGRHFRALSLDYIRLYDGARELLGALRAAGKGVYLLSNAQRIFTEWEMERLALTPLFDGICLSSDYGCKKPDRRFFGILFERYGIDPAGAVMVGNDGVCDVAGARAAGLSTVYIHSNISPREPLPDADFALERMDLARVGAILGVRWDGTPPSGPAGGKNDKSA